MIFVALSLILPHSSGFSILPHQKRAIGRAGTTPLTRLSEQRQHNNRRELLSSAVGQSATIFSILLPTSTSTANAFENRLNDRYADAIAQTGAQPKKIGVATRKSRTEGSYVGLQACGNTPNCYASSNPYADLPGRTILGWNGKSIKDVKKVIDTYEVNQNNIDGGGFKVIEYDEKDQYLYVQFQSYKMGYIDEFECWYNPKSGKFDVRSASREGYSDLGLKRKG